MNASASPSPNMSGRFSRALLRMFMRHASVTACETIADRFRLITLEGPALKACAWIPGHKIHIAIGSAFATRTYTPIEWDAVRGSTRILGYAHGEGPASAWLAGLKPGDACDIFGPRRSLDVANGAGPLAILGDESSIGLAHAFHQDRAGAVMCRFEVDDVEASVRITAHLGLGDVALFGREAGDAHIEAMEAALPPLVATGATFVLTGKAFTIQRLRRALKRQAVPAGRIVAKAYWAPGKTGLD